MQKIEFKARSPSVRLGIFSPLRREGTLMTSAVASTARRSDRLLVAAGIAAFVTYFGARLPLKLPGVPFPVAIARVPVLFLVLFVLAAVRMSRGLDELEQRIHLEALAFPAVLVLLLTLGPLQVAGVALSPQDGGYRHIGTFAFLFDFGGHALARRRYQ